MNEKVSLEAGLPPHREAVDAEILRLKARIAELEEARDHCLPAIPDEDFDLLRSLAERHIESTGREFDRPAPDDGLLLVHELNVRQVELEMQNDELRRRGEELEIANERLAQIFQNAPIGFAVLSESGRVVEANEAAQALFKSPRKTLVGDALASYVKKEHRPRLEKAVQQAAGAGEAAKLELDYLPFGAGQYGRLKCTISAREHRPRDRSGAAPGVGKAPDSGEALVALEDVTAQKLWHDNLIAAKSILDREVAERKLAEEKLARSLDFYLRILDNFPSLVRRADVKGKCNYFNKAWLAFTGRTLDEELGDGWIEGVHPDDRERLHASYENAIERRQAFSLEYRLRRRDGAYRIILDMGAPLYDLDGRFAGCIGGCWDVADERASRAALEKARDKAFAAASAKSRFLAVMSHEIRTPLSGVLGMLNLALDEPLSEELRDRLSTCRESAKSLLRIIHDILDFSKIEAGALDLAEEPFDLRRALDLVKAGFLPAVRSKGLDFSVEIDAQAPNGLVGDSLRLSQILTNLIGNAVKFTERGAVQVRVETAPARKPEEDLRIRFKVIDTGVGVSEEALERIFEVFTQADDSYVRRYQGAGLGLAVVKQLAKRMGGDCFAESALGRGSTFVCELPFRIAGSLPAPEPEADFAPPAPPLTVLLVEDERVNAVYALKLLEKAGHRVEWVGNGRDALDRLARGPYDVVLMDVSMPIMDGVETTRRIRDGEGGAENRSIPVAAMTAHALKGDRERFLAAGMSEYVSKPIEPAELNAMLARIARSLRLGE